MTCNALSRSSIAAALLLSCIASPAIRAEEPAGEAKPQPTQPAPPVAPPADGLVRPEASQPTPIKLEKAAYLGVSASPAPAVLRRQMKLPEGVGLVVDFVEPGGPAEAGGLKRFDVLHKLNDQLLINAEQMVVLVRTCKPGDELKLSIVREGEAQTLAVKLVEKELMPLEQAMNAVRWSSIQAGGLHFPIANPMRQPTDAPPETVRLELERAMREAMTKAFAGAAGGPMTIVWDDSKHALQLTGEAGRWSLVARSADGKTVFEGPINSPEEREKIPADVRKKLESIQLPGLPGGVPGAAEPQRPANPAPESKGSE